MNGCKWLRKVYFQSTFTSFSQGALLWPPCDSLLQLRKLRLKGVNPLVQGHSAKSDGVQALVLSDGI